MVDCGSKVSCIQQATLDQLLHSNAVHAMDVVPLKVARLLRGFNSRERPTRATHAVLLNMDTGSAQLTHTFMVVPHLGHPLLLGRDFLIRHPHVNHNLRGAPLYRFSTSIAAAAPHVCDKCRDRQPDAPPSTPPDTTDQPPPINMDYINYIKASATSCLKEDTTAPPQQWTAVLRRDLHLNRDTYVHAAVQVMQSDGVTPVTSTGSRQLAEIRYDHPAITRRRDVVGFGHSFIILETDRIATTFIAKGTIIGAAVPLRAATGDEVDHILSPPTP